METVPAAFRMARRKLLLDGSSPVVWLKAEKRILGGFDSTIWKIFEKYARQIGSFPQVGVRIKIFETTT